jgi:SAM-dependent methyltransferase
MKSDSLKAFITTVNQLGRTPKGFQRSQETPQATFKAIFKACKRTVHEIWEIYTQRREDLSRKLMNSKESVVAYLFGFHLPNIARASELYYRSNSRHDWKAKLKGKKVRVYDIGCGTAAMSLALGVTGDYFLIDSCGPLLDAAKILAEAAGLNAKTSRKNIEELEPKHFTSKEGENMVHIYLLGYVWNELVKNAPARRKLLTLMTNHIKRKESCLIFVAEPALEFMSRPAMELRDTLCENGYTALYPCPHSSPCPMLERPKDWCYTEGVWKQPPLAEWLDDQLDVNRSKHASTLFAFASPAMGLTSDNKPIVVGRPVREAGIDRYKGFFDYLLCDGNGITKIKPQKPKQAVLRGSIFTEE